MLEFWPLFIYVRVCHITYVEGKKTKSKRTKTTGHRMRDDKRTLIASWICSFDSD